MKCLFVKLFGRVTLPNRMNFWKGSKRQLTPIPHLSLWFPSREIMCMHFILSGPCTSLHIFDHIHYKKFATWFSENEGGVKGRLEFFWKFVRFGSAILPLKGHHHPHSLHHYSWIILLCFNTKVAKNGLLGGMEGWSGYSIFLPRAIRAQEPNMGVARICSHVYTITKILCTNNNMNEINCQNILKMKSNFHWCNSLMRRLFFYTRYPISFIWIPNIA